MGGREDFPQRSADRRSSGREGDRGWRWRDLFRAGPARHHRACYLAVEKEFTQAARRAALLTLHPGGLKKCYLCCRIKVLPMSPVAQDSSTSLILSLLSSIRSSMNCAIGCAAYCAESKRASASRLRSAPRRAWRKSLRYNQTVAGVRRYDVVLIGGGVIGSSVAMALGERGLKAAVLDIDLSGRLSSSEKNAGGVRATWWQAVNITLCRASIKYYESVHEEVGFRQKGYLWLYNAETWPKAQAHLGMQRELGHPIEELDAGAVHQRVPEIDRLDGIAGATFSPEDGLINSNLLKEHYRACSRALGAEYLDRVYVHAIDAGRSEVRIGGWRADEAITDDTLMRMMSEDGPGEAAAGHLIALSDGAVVIPGGAWSPSALKLVGLKNLSEPIRRQICLVDNRATSLAAYGMIVDTSGVYFHNDGAYILAGYSPPEEPPGYHFQLRRRAFLHG